MLDATPLPEPPAKMCTRCRQEKQLSDFYRESASPDGLGRWCKECVLAYRRAKPNGICKVDGCQRVTTGGQRKCNACYAGAPPLAQAHRTRGMPRHDAQGNRLCSDCLSYLPDSEFGRAVRVPDGLSRFCRTCARAKNVRKKYGLTLNQAEKMWASPCDICGFFESGEMVIDHSHGTGRVRGTLCHPCNVSIGHFKDDPDLLDKAARYLRNFADPQGSQNRPQLPAEPHAPRTKGWTTRRRRTSTCP
jgi:hypothetical protein